MSHSPWCMPVITINLGGEMIYILHQRLKAQKVPLDKEAKVLREVITAMFTPDFVAELFSPQQMYSVASTRQIFDKLAHSSLMRLNKTSMDKLYDLMTMSFKHQLVNCSHPRQYLQMTMLHMEAMRNIVGQDPKNASERALLDNAEGKLVALYGPGGACHPEGQLVLLKQSLMRFVQGRKIKASLFLQHNIQGLDGMFILSLQGPLPYGAEVPGVARKLSYGRTTSSYRLSTEQQHVAANVTQSASPWLRGSVLGTNMYTMNSSVLCAENAAEDAVAMAACLRRLESIHATNVVPTASEAQGASAAAQARNAASLGKGLDSSSAKAERSLTERLLGGAGASGTADRMAGRVSLSALLPAHTASGRRGGDTDAVGGFLDIDVSGEMMEIDARADAKTMDSMLEALDLKDSYPASAKKGTVSGGGGGGGAKAASYGAQAKGSAGGAGAKSAYVADREQDEDEDDLLALMDMAK